MTATIQYQIFETKKDAQEYLGTLPADQEAVAAFRKQQSAHYTSAEESFQRCDTDGFLSQWAAGISAGKEGAQAKLAEHDHHWVFRVLTDLEGNLVSTKLCKLVNRFAGYGHVYKWRVPNVYGGGKPEWVTDYKRPANFEKKGYKEAWIVAKAYATIAGGGTGLAGAASCYVAKKLDRDAHGLEI